MPRMKGGWRKDDKQSKVFLFWLFLFPRFSAHGSVCRLSYGGVLHSGIPFSCISYAVLLYPTRFAWLTRFFAVELNSLLAGYY